MAVPCPKCGIKVTQLFKCDACGDVRCSSSVISGSKGGCNTVKSPYNRPEGALAGKICYVCRKGKYQKI